MYTRAGDAAYLPDADLNNDGVINLLDVAVIKGNFGGTKSFIRIVSGIDSTKTLLIRAFDKWGSQSEMSVRVGAGNIVIVDP
jgi:hypothetical protein